MAPHPKAQSTRKNLFSWKITGPFDGAIFKLPKTKDPVGTLIICGHKATKELISKKLPKSTPKWQVKELIDSTTQMQNSQTDSGPLVLAKIPQQKNQSRDFGWTDSCHYSRSRQLAGTVWTRIEGTKIQLWEFVFLGCHEEEALGFMVGFEMSSYKFLKATGAKPETNLKISTDQSYRDTLEQAKIMGRSVNIARHLVNTPANILHPKSFSKAMTDLFANCAGTSVEVWEPARLRKEKLNLLLAVGEAAEHGPRLVRIRYRPRGAKNQPIAIVGKGITFDSGGLDLKPPAGMRLMKKDMGGSASVVGIAYWVVQSKCKVNCDFYLSLAENAVSAKSYRPGDVITSRNGMSVEIHNTDAEGRLALADAMDVAATQKGKDKPGLIIDLATLTGAARVGIGTGLAAVFSNRTSLSNKFLKSGQQAGDPAWPLPLYEPYLAGMKTNFADTNHCSTSRFGGAITAALFLSKFVRKIPWVHFDMMGWTETSGPFREAGANGQLVQCVAKFLESQASEETQS